MSALEILRSGPAMTLQDRGWQGTLALGLSQGGVADTESYAVAAALLGHDPGAVIEMAGMGGLFRAKHDLRVALTGADLDAKIDGQSVLWNAVHLLRAGQMLDLGAPKEGVYGLLAVGGGIQHTPVMGSCSTHRASGLGRIFQDGDVIETHPDPKPDRVGLKLPKTPVQKTAIRILPTAQTSLFSPEEIKRFTATEFSRAPRGNRQGIGLESDQMFNLAGGQSIASETVIPGDIQLPGDGTPIVLLADCQTTGGYPRIATVLPCDIPRVVQAGPGAKLRFTMITRDEGIVAMRHAQAMQSNLARECEPILRDPRALPDLLSYQLIGGAIAGHEEE